MISIKIIYSIIYWMFPQCILILNCEHISLFLLIMKKLELNHLQRKEIYLAQRVFMCLFLLHVCILRLYFTV